MTSPAEAVLLVDGVFLQRPELRAAWDLVVLLRVSEAEAHPSRGADWIVDDENPLHP